MSHSGQGYTVSIKSSTYSHFRVFSPDCTLHIVITDVISVLEWQSLTHDRAIGINVRLHDSNTVLTCVFAVYTVHLKVKTLKRLYL